MPVRPRSAVLAACAIALLALAPAAGAAIPFSPCAEQQGYECGALAVPLDPAGSRPDTLTLSVRRVRASQPASTALVPLAGGPGQAVLPLAAEFAEVLGPGLAARDYLVFDQRGTGASSPLRCSARGRTTVEASASCATQIGSRRAFFTTRESVADIEAVRREAGYEKLVLYGVSYGTKVALAYASAYPDRVEALILDSVVTPDGPDPFRRSTQAAASRALTEVCAGGACRGITPGAGRDLRVLAGRLRRRSLRGRVVDDRGVRRAATLSETGLFGILVAGDLNPTLRAELPGALRAVLRGDRVPILRLSVRSSGLINGAQSSVSQFGLFITTSCEEMPFAWTRGASVAQRLREIVRAAQAIPSSRRGPFGPEVAFAGGVIPMCIGWPVASAAPPAPAPPPALPTLILEGRADMRTPLEDAQRLAAEIPGAQLVDVAHVGHSVLGSDLSPCAREAVARFFAGQPTGPCAANANFFSPTPRPPPSLSAVRPVAGQRGRIGRTLSAVRATIVDARRQVIGETLAQGRRPARVGGLRSGRATVSGATVTLRSYEYVPGVVVSGAIGSGGAGTVRVRGRSAARGTLRIAANGSVTGTLAGRRVVSSFAARRRADRLPSMSSVLALPRF